MMNTIKMLFLLSIALITYNLFGETLSEYTPKRIGTISSGPEEGRIGYGYGYGENVAIGSGGYIHPRTFSVKNGKFFIPDVVNKRIVIFDLNFVHQKTIENLTKEPYTSKLEIDKEENIYTNVFSFGLTKIDKNGKIVYQIDKKKLPKLVYRKDNFFAIDDQLFIYNDNKEIEKLDDSGKIEKKETAIEKLKQMSRTNNLRENILDKLP